MSAVIIDDHHGDYYCPRCNRGFNSAAAVYQHCEDTSLHTWCASCHLTFANGGNLGEHLLYAEAHNTCDVCGSICRNSDALEDHIRTRNQPQWGCSSCDKNFNSASSMVVHLEKSCQVHNWTKGMTQWALSLFTKYFPIDYGIRVRETGPITCSYRGKSFLTASALCQHLQSESCQINYTGEEVLVDFVQMLNKGEWKKARRGSGMHPGFSHLLDRWDEGKY